MLVRWMGEREVPPSRILNIKGQNSFCWIHALRACKTSPAQRRRESLFSMRFRSMCVACFAQCVRRTLRYYCDRYLVLLVSLRCLVVFVAVLLLLLWYILLWILSRLASLLFNSPSSLHIASSSPASGEQVDGLPLDCK